MNAPKVNAKHLLKVTDFTRDEIIEIFKFTKFMKNDLKKGVYHKLLENKTLAMIFEKSSTRTRVSFEAGMFQLGGHALFLSKNDLQLGRGETVGDTAKVMARYCDLIMIRTFSHSIVEEMAANSTAPVINGLTDSFHPCQNLTDYYTIYEREDSLENIKLTYIGDGNNMTNSLMLGAAVLGVNFAAACPKDYSPSQDVIENAQTLAQKTGAVITVTDNIDEAIDGAQYLYTDVWASMGQEEESEIRKKALANYKISSSLLKKCLPDTKVMHCLPAHRGEEIDDDVMDSEQSIVFDQAENRMHVQKAIMCALSQK